MSSHVEMGTNRTGMATSPMDGAALVQIAKKAMPTAVGDAQGIAENRIAAAAMGEHVGSMPLPGSVKGAVKTFLKSLKGMNANVFVDKLGERLAFERTGVRLYEGLLSKLDAYGTWPGGPSQRDLEQHRTDELAHFEIVREAVVQLGGDPTVMTPAADLKAVASQGLVQVIADPRTDLFECLDVMLTAELTDNDGWEMLILLARDLGQDRLADDFDGALAAERRHLSRVRMWLAARATALLGSQPTSAPARGTMMKRPRRADGPEGRRKANGGHRRGKVARKTARSKKR